MATPKFNEGDRVMVTLDDGTKISGTISERKNSGQGESYVVILDDGRLEWRHISKLRKNTNTRNLPATRNLPDFYEGDRVIVTLEDGTTEKGIIEERISEYKKNNMTYRVHLKSGNTVKVHQSKMIDNNNSSNYNSNHEGGRRAGKRKTSIKRRKTRRSRKVRKTQKRR